MSEFVRLNSVEALHGFRIWLCKAVEGMQTGLDEADAEIQRTLIWVKQEQQTYWTAELRKRTELFTRAKLELKRKQEQKTPLGGRYSCVDEKKAMVVAKHRLEEAQQKVANIQRWSRRLEQENFDYQGAVRGLGQSLSADIPNAIGHLDRMITALDAYTSLNPSAQSEAIASALDSEEITRSMESMSVTAPDANSPSSSDDTDGEMNIYRRLSEQSPDQSVRDAVAFSETPLGWQACRLSDTEQAKIKALAVRREAAGDDEKVVIARGVSTSEQLFLLRSIGSRQGDSGWYLGHLDDTPVEGYDAVRVSDALASRPDLCDIMTLPIGYGVVINGAEVKRVFDDRGESVLNTDQQSEKRGDV